MLISINKQSLDIADGIKVSKDDLDVVCVVTKKKRNNVKLDMVREPAIRVKARLKKIESGDQWCRSCDVVFT